MPETATDTAVENPDTAAPDGGAGSDSGQDSQASPGDAAIDAKLAEMGVEDADAGAPAEPETPPDTDDGAAATGEDGGGTTDQAAEKGGEDGPGTETDEKPPDGPTKPDEAPPEPPESGLTGKQEDLLDQFNLTPDDLPAPGKARDALFEQLTGARRQISRQHSAVGEAMAKMKEAAAKPAEGEPPAAGTEGEGTQTPPDKTAEAPTESSRGDLANLEFSDGDLTAESDEAFTDKLNTLVKATRDVQARLAAVDGLTQRVDGIESTRQDDEDKQTAQIVDKFFAGLWDKDDNGQEVTDYPQFGKGPGSDLAPDSDEAQARDKIRKQAVIQAQGTFQVTGEDIPEDRALAEALEICTGKEIRDAVWRKVVQRVGKRRGKAIPRPGSRPRIPPKSSPDEKADKAIDDWGAEKGFKIPDD